MPRIATPERLVAFIAGGVLGVVFAAIGLVAGLLGGLEEFEAKYGVSAFAVAASYIACGLVAGAVVATGLPIAKRLPGAVVLGYVAALPFAITSSVAVVRPEGSWSVAIFTASIVALPGALVGGYAWRELHDSM